MRIFFILFITNIAIIAKSLYLAPLPLPKTYIINLDTKECGIKCLEEYLNNGEIFSFLANFKSEQNDNNLTKEYEAFKIKLNLSNAKNKELVKIALMLPKNVIGRYSINSTKSILSYLFMKGVDFKFELFDSKDESLQNIQETIKNIKNKGYNLVIALYTDIGAKRVLSIDSNLIFYIPTINKNEINTDKPNFIFGGIDYQKQIEKLLAYTNDKIAIFADQSNIGYKLSSYIENSGRKIVYKKIISPKTTKFKSFLRHNRRLNNSSIFLNTPLIKSSLLASQFRFYKIKPYGLFSTQVNYNPLLLSLTQYEDRKDMYIANSINKSDDRLVAINKILDNDIQYDWINYSTSLGVDYIYSLFFSSDTKRVFNENIINNQVSYEVRILKPTRSGFVDNIEF